MEGEAVGGSRLKGGGRQEEAGRRMPTRVQRRWLKGRKHAFEWMQAAERRRLVGTANLAWQQVEGGSVELGSGLEARGGLGVGGKEFVYRGGECRSSASTRVCVCVFSAAEPASEPAPVEHERHERQLVL